MIAVLRPGGLEKLGAYFFAKAKKYGPVVLVMLVSQAISATSLFSLPLLGLAVSDVYSAAVLAGNGAFTGIIMGVLYLLAVGRPSFHYWKLFGVVSACFSLILVGVACHLVLVKQSVELPELPIRVIFACFGLGGAFLAFSGIFAVREACYGNPLRLAGCTIAGNSGMLVAVGISLLLFRHSSVRLYLPVAAWMVMNVAQFLFVWCRRRSVSHRAVAPETGELTQNKILHAAALIIGVICSTVLPTFYITAVSRLPTGVMTLLFLSSRIASAVVGLGINAVLLVRYNWVQQTRTTGEISARFMLAAFLFGIVGIAVSRGFGAQNAGYVFVVLAWLACIFAVPLVLREMNARRLAKVMMGKVLTDLALSSMLAYFLNLHPSITGYYAVYMVSLCVNTAVAGGVFRNRLLSVWSFGTALCAGVLLVWGW